MAKPSVTFVLGGPGAGKGTQCALLVEKLNYVHISAGDCLREERSNPESKDGELIERYIKNGQIVPVEITVRLLKKKMMEHGWEKSRFLIDGFPRNDDNLRGWKEVIGDSADIFACLFFECSEGCMESRLLKRGQTSGRADDNLDVIRKRFEVFRKETMPIVKVYEEQGKLFVINADQDPLSVWEDVKKIMAH